jgi:tetratricopeptide (TPR) repeat protein
MLMVRRAAVAVSSLAFTTIVHVGTAGAGPQLATEQNRREALQVYRVGMELLSHEQFEKAADQFTRAISRDPLLTRAHYGAGQAYMGLRRYASAAKAYSDCLEAFRALHGLQISHRFEVEQLRDDEMRELRETIRALTQAGQSLRAVQAEGRLRDLERQRTTLEGPYQPPAAVLLALGSALYRGGNSEEAMAQWEAAVASDPRLGEAHNNLAVVYMQAGRLVEADRELKLAEKSGLRVNPQFKEDLKKASARR